MDENRTRPGLVWAIMIFYVFSAVVTLGSWFLMSIGALPLPPAQQAQMDNMSALDIAGSLILLLCNLSAAVSLFFLRVIAVRLFAASLAVHAFLTLWHLAKGDLGAGVGDTQVLVSAVVSYSIAIGVLYYAVHLRRGGVLR